MKLALMALIACTVLSGMAAAYATTTQRVGVIEEPALKPVKALAAR